MAESMPPLHLTAKQLEIAAFVWGFYLANDQLPPVRHVCERFGFASFNAGHEHLAALHRRGVLTKNVTGKWKFTALARAHFLAATDTKAA